MQEMQQKPLRQVAYKVRVSDVLSASFDKDNVYATYIKLNNANVSRVNLIATLVYKAEDFNYAGAVIDDGTGRISLRSFENKLIFSKADVGDVVLLIGRIREFNNERYIMPEILKKISLEWMNVRKLELMKNDKTKLKATSSEIQSGTLGEEVASINEEIYLLIKRLDTGNGVAIDDVIKNFDNIEAEKILNILLEKGDIFEVKPGKLKVLE